MEFQLDCHAPLHRELRRIIREQVADAAHCPQAGQRLVAERIHHARSSCKKVRAALLLFREVQPRLYAEENARFRDSARRLARFRDIDVMLACLTDFLEKATTRQPGRPFLAAARVELLKRRREQRSSHASLRRELSLFCVQMQKSHRLLGRRKIKRVRVDDVVSGFAATYRHARRCMPKAVTEAPDRFHRWRKWTKSCAYQCRLLRGVWPSVMKTLGHEFSRLGDDLGAEHDLSMLRAFLKQAAETFAPAKSADAGLRLVKLRRSHHRRVALTRGRKLFADKPAVMARRLRCWWPDGQS